MVLTNIRYKIKRRTWSRLVSRLRQKSCYPKLYLSYWHARFHRPKVSTGSGYFTAIPNPGAGIGHQLGNWIAGYWFARQFGLPYAHTPFSQQKWESFLGFGEGELSARDLIRKQGYRKVLIPLFDEKNPDEIDGIKRILASYSDRKVIFVAEQDQFYADQFGVQADLQDKFYRAPSRTQDRLIFEPEAFNIAIHVRRGDVVNQHQTDNPNVLMRWQGADYFENVLKTVVKSLHTDKKVNIYLFSQGQRGDFPEFEKFEHITFCLDMNPVDSFLHMVFADLLITSKSSFSYKPALLSRGIKVCPRNFWHGYPNQEDWILVEEDGTMDEQRLKTKQL